MVSEILSLPCPFDPSTCMWQASAQLLLLRSELGQRQARAHAHSVSSNAQPHPNPHCCQTRLSIVRHAVAILFAGQHTGAPIKEEPCSQKKCSFLSLRALLPARASSGCASHGARGRAWRWRVAVAWRMKSSFLWLGWVSTCFKVCH